MFKLAITNDWNLLYFSVKNLCAIFIFIIYDFIKIMIFGQKLRLEKLGIYMEASHTVKNENPIRPIGSSGRHIILALKS